MKIVNLIEYRKQKEKMSRVDILDSPFSYFIGNTPVLTTQGYREIKDIRAGTKVITHKNRVSSIVNTKKLGKGKIYKVLFLKTVLETTKESQFYVKMKARKGYSRAISIPCKDILKGDLVGISKHFLNNGKYPISWVEEDYYFYWVEVTGLIETQREETIYTLLTEMDNSFIVNGIAAINGQY